MDLNHDFSLAERAFRDGRLDDARALLGKVERHGGQHPAVLHLVALVEKGRGDVVASKAAFEAALRLAPHDARISNNYGNLLQANGEWEPAIRQFDQALAIDPGFAEALFNRALALEKMGRIEEAIQDLDRVAAMSPPSARLYSARGGMLRGLGRLEEAARAYDQALELEPGRQTALNGRARTALERGEPQASRYYERALSAAPVDLDLHLGLAEALEAEGDPRAAEDLARVVESRPEWAEGQSALARMRWAAGEGEAFARGFTRALESRPTDLDLWMGYITSLATADLWTNAAEAAEDALRNIDDPQLRLLAAVRWSEAGNSERAEQLLATLPEDFPGRDAVELRHRVREGDYVRALALAEADLRENPWDVPAWAMIGLLWQCLGDPRAEWLHGQHGLVAVQELELDRAEIEGIADVLRGLHRTRAHPLGQSLRGGTQTRGRLFDREEPEVRMLRSAIERAVRRHWYGLPPIDPLHPLLRHRDKDPRFDGSWSVRLTGGGFHVAHIHAGGLLSSACYLVVPEVEEAQEGWLEIGRPPPELRLPIAPLTTVEPRPGRLALFPSTLLHGTRPFAKGERLTAAFDIVAQ